MMLPYFLPYFDQPSWPIPLPVVGPVTIHAFGVLVALALIVGTWVARWHGQSRGQDPTHLVDGTTWTAIAGFVVAHIVSVVFYFPERLQEDPLQIFYIWNGLSSFGGFLGAAFGAYFYFKRRNLDVLAHMESIAVGLGPGWMLGRLGCTVAHDHPGHETTFFLAFDHPTRGPIHDLGFYEFLFAAFITAVIFYVRRLKWPAGSIPALMCIVYAPVRFGLDYLRIQDAHYDGLTPGQWMAIAMLVGGIILMRYSWKRLTWLELAVPGGIAITYGVIRFFRAFGEEAEEVRYGLSDVQWLAVIMVVVGGWLIYGAIRLRAAKSALESAGAKTAEDDGDEPDERENDSKSKKVAKKENRSESMGKKKSKKHPKDDSDDDDSDGAESSDEG